MSELRLNAIRLNTLSLNTMAINHIGFKKKASSSASGDVDENGYIIFADPEVARICAENWGDGKGITMEQAASVTSIGTVFNENTTITSFNELRYFTNVNTIPNKAFMSCAALKSIEFPYNVITIGNNAFYNCTSLVIDVTLPSLKTLEPYAFWKSGIKSFDAPNLVSIPDGYATDNKGCFADCQNLTDVRIQSATTIGIAAFVNCPKIEVFFAPAVETIGNNAFYNCTSLVIDVTLPSLKTLGPYAFWKSGIKSFDAPNLVSIPDGYATDDKGCFADCQNLTDVRIQSATTIGIAAFVNCPKIEVFFAPAVETIGNKAFYNAFTATTMLEFNSLRTISALAFYAANGKIVEMGMLSELPDNGQYSGVFRNSKNSIVIFPPSITSIGSYSFYSASTSTIVVKATTPPACGAGAINGAAKIYVPDASVEAYKTATNWVTYAARIFPIGQLATDNPELYAEIEEYL